MLSPSNRATATKLLNMETNDAYNLRYDESPNEVQHGSLKLLRPELWLNDEVINGFSMNYLAPKLRNGFIFKTHFMSQLLNTGTNVLAYTAHVLWGIVLYDDETTNCAHVQT